MIGYMFNKDHIPIPLSMDLDGRITPLILNELIKDGTLTGYLYVMETEEVQ